MNYFIHGLKNFTNFSGRSRRAEFWYFALFGGLIMFASGFLFGMIGIPIVGSLISLVFLVPAIAVGVRRMHDISKPGWFIIIPLYSLYLCTIEGDKGPNEFGADPKSVAIA